MITKIHNDPNVTDANPSYNKTSSKQRLKNTTPSKEYTDEDVEDYLIAEKGYRRYVNGGKKSTSLEDLAKEVGLDLKTL
jgi:predicted DNA-binding protein